jgi:hypothetical protein
MQFDQTDPKNLGRPLYFSLEDHIKAIESLIKSDELEMALQLCALIPAWQRENYPPELQIVKNTLYQQMYDSYEYSSEAAIYPEWTVKDAIGLFKNGYFYPRGEILSKKLSELNKSNEIPWICELSPSHGALALGLLDQGFRFKYFAKNINDRATDTLKEWLPVNTWQEQPQKPQKTMFVFFEALEHTLRQEDLVNSYYKLGIDFDEIYLSVPYGTLGGGLPDWQTRKLGHVRTYTQNEFVILANKFFPNRKWELTVSHSLILVGTK